VFDESEVVKAQKVPPERSATSSPLPAVVQSIHPKVKTPLVIAAAVLCAVALGLLVLSVVRR